MEGVNPLVFWSAISLNPIQSWTASPIPSPYSSARIKFLLHWKGKYNQLYWFKGPSWWYSTFLLLLFESHQMLKSNDELNQTKYCLCRHKAPLERRLQVI